MYFSLEGTFYKFQVGEDYEVILNNGYNYCIIYLTDKEIFKQFKKLIPLLCISTNFLEKYEILKRIGKGAFATVRRVINKTTGKYYAAKIFNTN